MIYIRKNGIYYENNYSPKADEYVMTKVKSIIPYLNEEIHIDSEITLEDLFAIVAVDEEIMNIVFGSHLGNHELRPYLDEVKKECMPESREEMDYIEFTWVAEQFNYKDFYEKFKGEEGQDSFLGKLGKLKEPDEDEVTEITIYIDVHAWGKFEPQEDEIYEKGEELLTHTSYAIEFTPIYRMKHLPIKLDKAFILRKEDGETVLVEGQRDFTVFEIFGAILSEISFAGLPEERDEQWKDVIDTAEEYKEREDNIEEDEDE